MYADCYGPYSLASRNAAFLLSDLTDDVFLSHVCTHVCHHTVFVCLYLLSQPLQMHWCASDPEYELVTQQLFAQISTCRCCCMI